MEKCQRSPIHRCRRSHDAGNPVSYTHLDIPGLNILPTHPQKDIIWDFPVGALFILQPPQQVAASIMEPKALKPPAVKAQGFNQTPCATVFDKFTDHSAGAETFSGKLRQVYLADLFHLWYPFEPVSYTHLDVYKRQLVSSLGAEKQTFKIHLLSPPTLFLIF